jgi:hypothetical protein
MGRDVQIALPRDGRGLKVVLVPFASLGGSIADSVGRPVPGARCKILVPQQLNVDIALLHAQDRELALQRDQEADSQGRFRYAIVPHGAKLRLFCFDPTSGRKEVDVSPIGPGEHRELSVTLDPPTSIVGSVDTSRLAPGAPPLYVVLFSITGSVQQDEARQPLSPDSAFKFLNITPGEKVILVTGQTSGWIVGSAHNARAEAFQTTDVGVIAVGGWRADITVAPEGVFQPTQLVDLNLHLPQRDPRRVLTSSYRVQPNERLEIYWQSPGEMEISASLMDALNRHYAGTHETWVGRIVFSSTAPTVVAIPLKLREEQPRGRLQVRTVFPPDAIPLQYSAAISLVRQGARVGGQFSSPFPGETTFQLGDHLAGHYEIWAISGEFYAGPLEVVLEAGQEHTVEISEWRRATVFSLLVVVRRDGEDLPVRALIEAIPNTQGEPGPENRGWFRTMSGEDGRAHLSVPPSTTYWIRVARFDQSGIVAHPTAWHQRRPEGGLVKIVLEE